MDSNKGKPKMGKQKQVENDDGDDKCYFKWDIQMEQALANILRDERSLGNKGDGGWKGVTFNRASSILSVTFNKEVSANNVRNCVKTWKKPYGIVSDILSQSGFSWDATKKMITTDDEGLWLEYLKSHADAKKFRWKVISNWDDIVNLCAKDRATCEGGETAKESVETSSWNDVVDVNNLVEYKRLKI